MPRTPPSSSTTETLRPKYRLHIGDIGQSNALKIARQLRLSEHVVERAESYLAQRPVREAAEWEMVQKLRKEADLARQGALQAQAEAERTREVLAQRLAQLQDEAQCALTQVARERISFGPFLGY